MASRVDIPPSGEQGAAAALADESLDAQESRNQPRKLKAKLAGLSSLWKRTNAVRAETKAGLAKVLKVMGLRPRPKPDFRVDPFLLNQQPPANAEGSHEDLKSTRETAARETPTLAPGRQIDDPTSALASRIFNPETLTRHDGVPLDLSPRVSLEANSSLPPPPRPIPQQRASVPPGPGETLAAVPVAQQDAARRTAFRVSALTDLPQNPGADLQVTHVGVESSPSASRRSSLAPPLETRPQSRGGPRSSDDSQSQQSPKTVRGHGR